MIEEEAIVIAIENFASKELVKDLVNKKLISAPPENTQSVAQPNIAILEIMRHTPCGICGQTRGCGNAIWGKIFTHKSSSFKVNNTINAKVGDGVIVGIDEQVVLKSALLLYALPLATMMLGALLSTIIVTNSPNQADLYAVIGAITGLTFGFIWLKGHTVSKSYHTKNQAVLLRISHSPNL